MTRILSSRQNGASISVYEDFFQWKENTVLDYCRLAQGGLVNFTDKTHRQLIVLLDERNAAAHANYRNVTVSVAQAHIEKLIALISDQPFR